MRWVWVSPPGLGLVIPLPLRKARRQSRRRPDIPRPTKVGEYAASQAANNLCAPCRLMYPALMPYQAAITVKTTLDRIWKHDYVLPAIQREFVWNPNQICKLFDSLMQGFPVGSFLFWKIEPATAKKFRFFDFSREYHQRDNPHCPPLGKAPDGPVTAVLDGQQRLTALNVGLRGSLAVKEPNKWWNNPRAFPVKKLYLDLLHEPVPDEEGTTYRFEFLTDERAAAPTSGEFWFPVNRIFGMGEPSEPMVYLAEQGLGNTTCAVKTLFCLQAMVHNALVMSYYEEENQDIEKVLTIFIRTNSGGTVLSYSDLLLSIATAQWEQRDARSEINTLVDALNVTGLGFNFSKDFVLKAGLMVSDIASVGFKVENFDRDNMKKLESSWPQVAETLRLTARLIASFGLSRDTITADSALLPVAYYLHRRECDDGYLTSKAEAEDRAIVKRWLIRSLIKPGIWGSGLDVLLTALREIIRNASGKFPDESLEREMRVRGKSLTFSPEEVEELADMKYGSRDLFGLLTLLFPFVNTRNQFHIDHVFPSAVFHARKLKQLGFSEEEIARLQDRKDRLPNLQLLEGPDNQSKNDQMPDKWIAETYKKEEDRKDYISRHMLDGVMTDLFGFEAFFKARRQRLLERIVVVLNGPVETAA
jgi:hypothetical protein